MWYPYCDLFKQSPTQATSFSQYFHLILTCLHLVITPLWTLQPLHISFLFPLPSLLMSPHSNLVCPQITVSIIMKPVLHLCHSLNLIPHPLVNPLNMVNLFLELPMLILCKPGLNQGYILLEFIIHYFWLIVNQKVLNRLSLIQIGFLPCNLNMLPY